MKLGADDFFPGMDAPVADVLLSVHRSYLRAVRPVLDRIHAMAHITGGGLPGNLDRALPAGLSGVVDRGTWEIPPVFAALQDAGDVPEDEMFRVFNMGVGLVAIASRSDADEIVGAARVAGVTGWVLGEVRPGSGEVILG
jgi:phosphoribosylformylglycinamidine cyclo-ligase